MWRKMGSHGNLQESTWLRISFQALPDPQKGDKNQKKIKDIKAGWGRAGMFFFF